MGQLQDFAIATSAPLGYFFLPEPPVERLPIPDYRTVSDSVVRQPSGDLLDTIHLMQQRQEWLRDTLIEQEAEPLGFVGSGTLKDVPEAIGQEMRAMLGLDGGWAREVRTWKQAVTELRRAIESIGVMAVINGIVGNNTHRKLDVGEFRGFALSDRYAPLIFVNGADWESAKMFTLAHELAHIWLGQGALSGFERLMPIYNEIEVFCNTAAAEFLVPQRELREFWPTARRTENPFAAVARCFKVSPIVGARRALDLRLITRDSFFDFYEEHRARHQGSRRKDAGGGDFYKNQNTRIGARFATEVMRATKEGRLLYRDAYRLTGLHGATFARYAKYLGFGTL